MSLFILVVILALIFDFINGFHDAANSIATIVSTKVLSPLTAVLWAAGFNFLAFALFNFIDDGGKLGVELGDGKAYSCMIVSSDAFPKN